MEKIKIPKYLDLTLDEGFKDVFGKAEHKYLLIELLNTVIKDRQIEDLIYLDKESNPIGFGGKRSVCDVRCRTSDGSEIIVEIQRSNQKYFSERLLYEGCLSIAGQLRKTGSASRDRSEDYALLPVYVISILCFKMKHTVEDDNKVLWRYSLMDIDNHNPMTYAFNFIFLELANFTKSLDSLESFEEKMYFCLKNISKLEKRPENLDDKYFDTLFEVSRFEALSPDEQSNYLRDMTTKDDVIRQIAFAKEEGIVQGREEGRKEGREEGREEKSEEIAKNLIKIGLSTENIANATGLSCEIIRALEKKICL